MRKFLICLLFLSFSSFHFAMAQSQSELMLQAQKLIEKMNESAAYPILIKAVKTDNTNVEALCMAAFYGDREGNRQTDKQKANDYFKASQIFAEAAYKLNAKDAEANYALAVALGRIALTSSNKEKINVSKRIKELGERCLQLNPSHAGAYHLLGKWHYEVFNLNFVEKAAINMLFGGMPTANIAAAITNLQKAILLKPTYLLYQLDYAKALQSNNKKEEATIVLKKIIVSKPTTQDDAGIIAEAKILSENLIFKN